MKRSPLPLARAWRVERLILSRWPVHLQHRYLAALARFDPPIPDAERRRLEAAVRRSSLG